MREVGDEGHIRHLDYSEALIGTSTDQNIRLHTLSTCLLYVHQTSENLPETHKSPRLLLTLSCNFVSMT